MDCEALLAEIDSVDWHGLEDYEGAADAVPGIFLLLLEGNRRERKEALEDLVHRAEEWGGGIYSSAPYIYRYLIRVLADQSREDSEAILNEVASAGVGATMQTEGDQTLYAAVLEEIAQGTPEFLSLLRSKRGKSRSLAASLLTYNPARGSVWGPAIVDLLEDTLEPSTRGELLVHASKAKNSISGWVATLEREFASGDPFVRFVAGSLLVCSQQPGSNDVVDFLKVSSIESLNEMREMIPTTWSPVELFLDACKATGREKGLRLLAGMLPVYGSVSGALSFAGDLLSFCFEERSEKWSRIREAHSSEQSDIEFEIHGPIPHTLPDGLQGVLRAIAATDALWVNPTNGARVITNLWTLFGLPSKRRELILLAEQLEKGHASSDDEGKLQG